jgi:hypothetical protein
LAVGSKVVMKPNEQDDEIEVARKLEAQGLVHREVDASEYSGAADRGVRRKADRLPDAQLQSSSKPTWTSSAAKPKQ